MAALAWGGAGRLAHRRARGSTAPVSLPKLATYRRAPRGRNDHPLEAARYLLGGLTSGQHGSAPPVQEGERRRLPVPAEGMQALTRSARGAMLRNATQRHATPRNARYFRRCASGVALQALRFRRCVVWCFGRRAVWRGLARRAFLSLAIAGLAGLAASCGGQSIPANQATPAGVASPVHVVDRRGEEGIATGGAQPRWRSARDFEMHYQKHLAEVGVQRPEV